MSPPEDRPPIPPELSQFIVLDDFTRYGLVAGQPTDGPRYLQVELTDLCNLACAGCLRAVHPSVGSHLSLASFAALLDQAPEVEQVSFVGAGEALLVRDFARYVALCTDRSVFSSCNTNGLLIPRRLPSVLDAGLGLVAVSVDGADDETLAMMRSGLRLSRLTLALRTAVELTGGTPTRVSAAVTLSVRNVTHFPEIVTYVAEHGVREVTVESLHHWGNDKSLNAESLFALDPDTVVPHLEAGLREALRLGLRLSIFDYRRLYDHDDPAVICPWPWDASYVTKDGLVTPCCVHLEASDGNVLGNALRSPMASIWSGPRYRDLRSSFMTGCLWDSCKSCVYRREFGRAR
jgi:MoaA/NifB/PqqE/SkfB family radical SAM enzyme